MPDGQIRLKGAVEPGVVADMLQFLSGRPDRVGFLRVFNRRHDGRVWYKDGAIVSAECGAERDLDAIRHILRLKTGEFSFVDTNLVPQRTIFEDTTSILLECFRQIDEGKEAEPDEPDTPPLAPATPRLDGSAGPGPDSESPFARSSYAPRPPVLQQAAAPVTPVHRPAAPWAEQGTGSSAPALSQATPPPAPAAAAATPATPAAGTAPSAAEPVLQGRPRLNTSAYKAPPRRAPRPERLLLIGVCAVLLLVSGLLLWRVLGSRPQDATGTGGATPGTSSMSPAGGRLAAWLESLRSLLSSESPASVAPDTAPISVPGTPVNWPAIRLSGIIAVPNGTGSALINGRMILEGQTFDGILLDTVTKTGVLLRCGEATKFVSDSSIGDPNERAGMGVTNRPAGTAATNAPAAGASGIRGWFHRWSGR
jgi:hypothetical protein